MPKQGKNIYLRKDGRWEGRYIKERVNGKIRYGYVFGKSYEEALDKLTRAASQDLNSQLDVLIQVMEEALPEELMDTLHNVQIASLKAKKLRAQAAVATAAVAAAGEGAAPIPFADCALLIPTQLGMIACISPNIGQEHLCNM